MEIDVQSLIKEASNKELFDTANFSDNLMKEIDSIRSNPNLSTNNKNGADYVKESYCHAFYRILGLPVISATKAKFYNPGFNPDISSKKDEIDNKKMVDAAQDPLLLQIEKKRELSAQQRTMLFENPGSKMLYRLDMLKVPIKINILKEQDALTPDNGQEYAEQERSLSKTVTKILRPFKCYAGIVNDVKPSTNQICAPFVMGDTIRQTKLSRTYLEVVAKIRLSNTVRAKGANNEFLDGLKASLASAKIDFLDNVLKEYSEVETYIVNNMLKSLIFVSLKTREERNWGQEVYTKLAQIMFDVAAEIDGEKFAFPEIDKKISALKTLKLTRELMLGHIPTYKMSDGSDLQEFVSCKLNSGLIGLVQNGIEDIDDEISELEDQKTKLAKMFNELNKNLYYSSGEVTGLGLVDIMSIMIAFWLLPESYLVSFFDDYAFERLYMYKELRSEEVEARKSGGSKHTIEEVLNMFDGYVVHLLEIANEIIVSDSAR